MVDERALLEALDAGAVRAGLDVFADEPSGGKGPWDSALARHPGVVATHHIGASTEQAQRAIAAGVTEIVDAFMSGEARHCVNLERSRLGSFTLTVRHLDRVGVLAEVLDRLSGADLNVEHMQNRIFRGGEAAVASIDVAGQASDELLTALRGIPHVLGVSEVTLGRDSGARVSVVRPFPARVVRPDWAPRLVTGLSELPEDTGTLPPVAPIDPSAYDESEAALYVYRQARGDVSCTGVVCDVAIRAFVAGQVRGHEAVQTQRVESLVRHHETTDAPPALVALLHHAGPALHPHARRGVQDAADPRLRRSHPPSADGVARRRGGGHREPRRRAGRRGPLHRRRPPPGRSRALDMAPGRRARGRRRALRDPPDGRPAALRVPPSRDRARGSRHPSWACSRRPSASRPSATPPTPAPGSFGLYADGSWHDVTPHGRQCEPRRRGAAGAGLRPSGPHHRDRARAHPRRRADPPVRQRRGCALHARAATARGPHPAGGRRWGDAAEDDVLRAQALRRDLPAARRAALRSACRPCRARPGGSAPSRRSAPGCR